MHLPVRLTNEFEGKRITTFKFQGRPCWIARQIGAAIGYSHRGKRFVNKITGEWADEFIPGHDYELLQGDTLQAFRELFELGSEMISPKTRSLIVLYEPGLHLSLTRTNKPVGRRLRRFLADEVLPQLARGPMDSEPSVPPEEPEPNADPREIHLHISPARVRMLDVRLLREQRLMAQHDLRRRMFEAESLRTTVRTLAQLGSVREDVLATYEVLATEIALGLSPASPTHGPDFNGSPTRRRVSLEDLVEVLRDLEQRRDAPPAGDTGTPGTDSGDADDQQHQDAAKAVA